MHKKERPLVVVVERYPTDGPEGHLVATQMRCMTSFEWYSHKLTRWLCKKPIKKPPTGFPSISIGVWIAPDQYNKLLGRDEDSITLPARYIAREMVLMQPELLMPDAYDGSYQP